MQIAGEWHECSDGIVRPTVVLDIRLAEGSIHDVRFVLDTAADQTVLSAALLPAIPRLLPAPPALTLSGVGGAVPFGIIAATLELRRQSLSPVTMRGEFPVFAELAAIDMCVLGRDVTDHFDVIVSRRHNTVLLLGGNHRFAVEGP